MPDDLRVSKRVTIPGHELAERFSRSPGAGGQKVNTTDTRVELRFDVQRSTALPEQLRARAVERLGKRLIDGVLAVTASQHRSQLQNRRQAREQLVKVLSAALAPPPKTRRPTSPSQASKQRRLANKKHRSMLKHRRQRGDPGEN